MALNATIFKASLQIADLDRQYYQDHALTLARHPSETDERLMVRLAAFALNAGDNLQFGRGLSDADEPDLWQRDLSGHIELWIEVGLPDEKALRRACSRAERVRVYRYGGQAATLWTRQLPAVPARNPKLEAFGFESDATRELAALAQRNMRLQITIQEGEVLVTDGARAVTLKLHAL